MNLRSKNYESKGAFQPIKLEPPRLKKLEVQTHEESSFRHNSNHCSDNEAPVPPDAKRLCLQMVGFDSESRTPTKQEDISQPISDTDADNSNLMNEASPSSTEIYDADTPSDGARSAFSQSRHTDTLNCYRKCENSHQWPEEARTALRLVQEQLNLQRAQLLELQRRVVDLSRQASAPVGQRKPFGVFSNPFRCRQLYGSKDGVIGNSLLNGPKKDVHLRQDNPFVGMPTEQNDSRIPNTVDMENILIATKSTTKSTAHQLSSMDSIRKILKSQSYAQATIPPCRSPFKTTRAPLSTAQSLTNVQASNSGPLLSPFVNRHPDGQNHTGSPKDATTSSGNSKTDSLQKPRSSPPIPQKYSTGLPSGVWYDRVENRYVVQCRETTGCGRKKRKYFGIARYGEENARNLAIATRLHIIGLSSEASDKVTTNAVENEKVALSGNSPYETALTSTTSIASNTVYYSEENRDTAMINPNNSEAVDSTALAESLASLLLFASDGEAVSHCPVTSPLNESPEGDVRNASELLKVLLTTTSSGSGATASDASTAAVTEQDGSPKMAQELLSDVLLAMSCFSVEAASSASETKTVETDHEESAVQGTLQLEEASTVVS